MINKKLSDNLKRKIKFVCLDIDDDSIFNFLLTYLLIKNRHPTAEIICEISPSGKGFHITIRLKEPITILENLLERSLFDGEDSMRLKLNLKKLYISDGKDTNPDLLFTEKAGKKAKMVPISSVLRPYSKELMVIESKWGSNEALELIKALSDKIKTKIHTKKGYVTSIGIKGEVLLQRIKKIAMDISMKDKTFKWKIFKSYFPAYDFAFCVFSGNKDTAFQRGSWFVRVIKKELNLEILYYVKKL